VKKLFTGCLRLLRFIFGNRTQTHLRLLRFFPRSPYVSIPFPYGMEYFYIGTFRLIPQQPQKTVGGGREWPL